MDIDSNMQVGSHVFLTIKTKALCIWTTLGFICTDQATLNMVMVINGELWLRWTSVLMFLSLYWLIEYDGYNFKIWFSLILGGKR